MKFTFVIPIGSFASSLRHLLSDVAHKFQASAYNVHYVQMKSLNSQPSDQRGVGGRPCEVPSSGGIQNLNKLMKSCGESETEQLSGLLAVHGWSVP